MLYTFKIYKSKIKFIILLLPLNFNFPFIMKKKYNQSLQFES